MNLWHIVCQSCQWIGRHSHPCPMWTHVHPSSWVIFVAIRSNYCNLYVPQCGPIALAYHLPQPWVTNSESCLWLITCRSCKQRCARIHRHFAAHTPCMNPQSSQRCIPASFSTNSQWLSINENVIHHNLPIHLISEIQPPAEPKPFTECIWKWA